MPRSFLQQFLPLLLLVLLLLFALWTCIPATGSANSTPSTATHARFLAIAATGFAGILIVAFWMARRQSRALESITATARGISEGELHLRAHAGGVGELDPVAASLNALAADMQSRWDTLTRERNQLLTVLGGMAEGVVAVDQEERVLHMNSAAGAIFQAAPSELVGKRVWEAVRLHEFCTLVSRTVKEGVAQSEEMRILSRGADQWVLVLASPLKNGNGKPSGAVAVLQDLTKIRRLEAMRRDFVANVSHELKTPITAIRGFAEAMVDDADMAAELRQRFMQRIHSQVLRLSAVVTDLLTLSRLEFSGANPEFDYVELRDILKDSLQSLLPQGEEGIVRAVSELGDEGCTVMGDEQLLRMLFDNLLDNARKYTAKGRITARLKVVGSSAVVEIEDTGIGIDEEHLERIFERFYRVDKARSRELGGTGLGLSIVKHICLAHGGEVSVESTLGKGSCFRVILPLAEPEPAYVQDPAVNT